MRKWEIFKKKKKKNNARFQNSKMMMVCLMTDRPPHGGPVLALCPIYSPPNALAHSNRKWLSSKRAPTHPKARASCSPTLPPARPLPTWSAPPSAQEAWTSSWWTRRVRLFSLSLSLSSARSCFLCTTTLQPDWDSLKCTLVQAMSLFPMTVLPFYDSSMSYIPLVVPSLMSPGPKTQRYTSLLVCYFGSIPLCINPRSLTLVPKKKRWVMELLL